jgi:hypothetical protein
MKLRLAALLLLAALPAQAQSLGPICPDRPGKGAGPCTLAPGHAQVELGLFDESFQRRSGVTIDTGNAGALLAKYGVSDRVDIEAGMALYQFQRVHGAAGTFKASGMGDLFLRTKINPLSGAPGNESSPFTFVLGPTLKLPTAARSIGNGHVEGGLVAPMAYDLGNNWSLAMAPEADVLLNGSGSGYHANLTDVVEIGHGFGNLTLGAEVWSAQNLDPAGAVSQYSFDLDAAYLIGNNTQLDGGINLGLNRATPDAELYFGVSKRF